jgi:hypothetical protein
MRAAVVDARCLEFGGDASFMTGQTMLIDGGEGHL